jgi:hypothetical protein
LLLLLRKTLQLSTSARANLFFAVVFFAIRVGEEAGENSFVLRVLAVAAFLVKLRFRQSCECWLSRVKKVDGDCCNDFRPGATPTSNSIRFLFCSINNSEGYRIRQINADADSIIIYYYLEGG